MGIFPAATVDLSASVGAGPGDLWLRIYDEPTHRRFTVDWGGTEGPGVSVPWPAVPFFEASVGAGSPSLFLSPQIDFTAGGLSTIGPPAMPGFWAIPLSMRLIAKTVTATAGPTLTVGNGPGIASVGSNDNMAPEQGGWIVTSVPSQIGIVGTSMAPLVDLSTQIKVNVITPASGGSFLGRIALVLQLIEAF